jgi:RNA polymerase sigma-70 factor (ECF subfamily)
MSIFNLVKKAQKGNEKAFLKLFQKYEEDIYRTAFVYVKNQEDALDVVQETAYRSFKSITTLKEPNYFKTWLIRICMSCSIDLLRKRKNVVHLNPESQENIPFEDQDVPLTVTLKDLLDSLNDQEKSVVILRFYHDYTIKETAELVELPLGTVKTVLYRALNKLKKQAKEGELYEQ